jgi:hypothetical protein
MPEFFDGEVNEVYDISSILRTYFPVLEDFLQPWI